MPALSLNQIANAINGELLSDDATDVVITGMATDSRAVKSGDLFWAMRGTQRDGHQFVTSAIQNGVSGAVVEASAIEKLRSLHPEFPFLVVDDTLVALGKVAVWHRQTIDPLVIGVTGSVGKTTTRHMIHAVLSQQFQGQESPRNYNNHVGLPLSLMQLNPDDEYSVLEMGASNRGEIDSLARIAQPEIGIITTIGPSHLSTFGSLENIIATKAELISQIPETGLLILSGDEKYSAKLKQQANCRVVLVGTEPQNDLQATEIETTNTEFSFQLGSERISIPVAGRHHLLAVLTAIAIGQEVGMDARSIRRGLEYYQPIPGRSYIEQIGNWTILNDCYNANPLSMKAACETATAWKTDSQKIFVAGEMLELGGNSARYHHEFGQQVANSKIDFLLAIGTHADDVVRGAFSAGMSPSRCAVFDQIDTLFAILSCWLQPNDFVVVKGSRGMHMERVIDWIREQAEQQLSDENKESESTNQSFLPAA